MKTNRAAKSIFLTLSCMLIHGAVAARDGLIFKDVAPISVKFEFFNYSPPVPYISFLNTGDEIVHDITISNVINGKKVSVIMTDTIHPHKSVFITDEKLINELRKVGLKNDGSGVSGEGLTITCKYYTKPTPINGWWESNLKVPFRIELTSKKTGRKYFVDFEREPTSQDIEEAIEYFDSNNDVSK